jgi:hypothetical protein
MPCYEINLVSVEFNGNSTDLLKAIGFNVRSDIARRSGLTINLQTGIITGQQDDINRAKREYSYEAVKRASGLGRWTLTKKSENQYEVIKW